MRQGVAVETIVVLAVVAPNARAGIFVVADARGPLSDS